MMKERTSLEVICSYLPERISHSLARLTDLSGLTEVRLRTSRPAAVVFGDSCKFITSDGSLTLSPANTACIIVSPEEISRTVDAICRYSRHSFEKELAEGCFVIENGIRVGAAGRRNSSSGGIIRDISSLNVRFAREVIGCADDIYRNCGCKGLLIAGRVNSGKTTILRDLCRLSGNSCKTVLIDERNEISATTGGIPGNDIGVQTDVLIGYERSDGIIAAVRTLSPEVIFCDEIAAQPDVDAILSALGSGVQFTATIHAGSFDELLSRRIAAELIDAGAFEYLVLLGEGMAQVKAVRRLRNAC